MNIVAARLRQIRIDGSVANVGIAAFALLAAWSVRFAWTRPEDGYVLASALESHAEQIVFATTLCILLLCAARFFRLIGTGIHAVACVALTVTAISTVAWVRVAVVGDVLYADNPASRLDLERVVVAGEGLGLATTSSIGMLLCALTFSARHHVGAATGLTCSPLIARLVALFALLSASSVFMPWLRSYGGVELGFEYRTGLIVLTVSVITLLSVPAYASGQLSERGFRATALILAGTSVVLTTWLLFDRIESDTVEGDLVQRFLIDPVRGGPGLYLSLFASAAAVATVWPARAERTLRPAPFAVSSERLRA